uniref:Uncharacterized protein n=1 Tax=Echeneis naucrates TaxID=173247 RepID=A0A665WTQ6_ECHNA
RMKAAGVLLILSVGLGAAQRAEGLNSRGCTNLTLVLDNWKYAITTQVKDLLLHDHSTVLPDYGRIQPLSEAVGHLYEELNALKLRLAELTDKFGDVEAFVDDARRGGPPRRRTRVVVRRVQKAAGSLD